MKALKINVIVNTTAGIQIPAGAIVVPAESLKQRTVTNPDKTRFKCVFVLETYASQTAFENKKAPISSIVSDYPMQLNSKARVVDFEQMTVEAFVIKEVKQELKKIYTGANDVEEINISLP